VSGRVEHDDEVRIVRVLMVGVSGTVLNQPCGRFVGIMNDDLEVCLLGYLWRGPGRRTVALDCLQDERKPVEDDPRGVLCPTLDVSAEAVGVEVRERVRVGTVDGEGHPLDQWFGRRRLFRHRNHRFRHGELFHDISSRLKAPARSDRDRTWVNPHHLEACTGRFKRDADSADLDPVATLERRA
jgi:hypothetical protein